jgi:hypothetical protein
MENEATSQLTYLASVTLSVFRIRCKTQVAIVQWATGSLLTQTSVGHGLNYEKKTDPTIFPSFVYREYIEKYACFNLGTYENDGTYSDPFIFKYKHIWHI